ncbi:RxLR-like protein [Phytophthora cinnamomi]|uniref:RxLR-like protein n=1 Tax=Phytophthora cinnamomi TaxID=4785 RepID=UPI003559E3E8|nr:RxLR-like protein [Phytophthora cinnamomi]
MFFDAVTVTSATPVNFYNHCSTTVELYNNTYAENIDPGCSATRDLEEGFSRMYRNGWHPQATLAEFSVSWGFLWYDISIIPTGIQGPGNCSSLENCKMVTGGVGFNTPMRIAPSGCTTITCLAAGCDDAYQYPTDNFKTHACCDTTPNVDVTFCPGGRMSWRCQHP